MLFFGRKYIEGLRAELREVKRELREYTDTEFSPYEIYMMSERLSRFEEAGIEPDEAIELAEKAKEKEALRLSEYCQIRCCPECGSILGHSKEYFEKHPYCDGCGQRVGIKEAQDECI